MKPRRFKFYLGIDVAKAKLDFCLLPDEGTRPLIKGCVPNSAKGFIVLFEQIAPLVPSLRQLHCTFEATGSYTRALAAFLHLHKVAYSEVNPAKIKYFGQSHHARTKTDPADARRIAQFGQERSLPLSEPLAPATRRFQAIVHELQALVEQCTACRNRLHASEIRDVQDSLHDQIQWLEQRIAQFEAKAQQIIDDEPIMKSDQTLLRTITGIAQRSSLLILAELAGKKFQSARQLAAYSGLTPREQRSGESVKGRTRLCKIGNACLRAALYMPAQSARRHCLTIKTWADDIANRGKAPKAVIGAVMRKLSHIIFGVLKHQSPFDPNKAAFPSLTL
jgi:transposase